MVGSAFCVSIIYLNNSKNNVRKGGGGGGELKTRIFQVGT